MEAPQAEAANSALKLGRKSAEGRCRHAPGSAEKKDVSPARALATERPFRNRTLPDRTPSRRPHPDRAVPAQRAAPSRTSTRWSPSTCRWPQFAVNAVASRISLPGHVSRDDLLSCAHVALVEVARRFDPAAGASFATYALARLQGAVLDELRSGDWASRSVRAAARRTDAAADALAMALGRPPDQGGARRQPRRRRAASSTPCRSTSTARSW